MRLRDLAAGAAAAAAALLAAPGALHAASGGRIDAPAHPAQLRLAVAPRAPRAGQEVELQVVVPARIRARAHVYRWSLGGASGPVARIRPRAAGRLPVTVRVLGRLRTIAVARTVLTVRRPAAARRGARRRVHRVHRAHRARVAAAAARTRRPPRVRAAAATTVTISDFKFTASSITVNAGDTVTWVNDGPTNHTATASSGGFDTGILRKGQSASHTFSSAGTYSYICSLHPFMHGTVVVAAASATQSSPAARSTTGTGSANGAAAAQPGSAARTSSGTLPFTGLPIAALLGGGLLMLGGGAVLRRRFG